MPSLTSTLADLTARYLELHTRKEDLFWDAKMGLSDAPDTTRRALADAEVQLGRFLQDPERLRALRSIEADGDGTPAERATLRGWIAMFAAHTIEDSAARALSEKIVEKEAELESARSRMELGYVDPATGQKVRASSVKLGLMMRSERDEDLRRAAYDGLRTIEQFVLDRGFLDIVRMRNQLGRMLGYADYYDWRVSTVERMSKKALFTVLEDLVQRTVQRSRAELLAFSREHGGKRAMERRTTMDPTWALEPWNFPYLRTGEIQRELDPYFAFEDALSRWGRSFHALGVRYRGATLTLDLVDRRGKYENGFMHGPGPAFYRDGAWQPARINFTANAVPGVVGSGLRAAETLFHEGGHAAHFANILSDAPCFSQEFAPTSVAYAETQSMFMDSLLGDADWRVRYALNGRGEPMPMALVEAAIREQQPFRAWDVRAMLTVPFAEKAIYEMPESELTPKNVLSTLREVEQHMQGLTAGVRPVLAVPHLIAGESSAYYHGYVLAEMAVYQTREFFLARDGHLTDNPRIGPDLAATYWKPGNAVPFDDTVRALTGRSLNADALVAVCNRTVDEAIEEARTRVKRSLDVPTATGPVELDAHVRVLHGRETIADSADGWDVACAQFSKWIAAQSPQQG